MKVIFVFLFGKIKARITNLKIEFKGEKIVRALILNF